MKASFSGACSRARRCYRPTRMSDTGQGLRDAAYEGDCAKIAALLDAGVYVDAENRPNQTPLFYAAIHGRVDAICLLLDCRGRSLRLL